MNILGMGPTEILLIVVLALIVFGPAKLPEIMGNVGRAIADFRRATSQLSDEFNRTIQAELNETRALVDDTKSTVTGVQTSINSALTGIAAPIRTAEPANGVAAANGTNGTTPTSAPTSPSTSTPAAPAMADNLQWSWESAAPAPIAPAVQVADSESATLVSDSSSQTGSATPPEPDQASRRTPRKSARDELQPPY